MSKSKALRAREAKEEASMAWFRASQNQTTTDNKPKLKLIGADGNTFNLLGLAHKAALTAGWPKERWATVRNRAMTGNYDHLLVVLQEEFVVR